MTGIEPVTSAWKAEILPLNYTRMLEHHPIKKPNGELEGTENPNQQNDNYRNNCQLPFLGSNQGQID